VGCWERFAHYYYRRTLTIRKINCLSSGGIYIRDPGLYTHRECSLLPSKLNSCYNPVSDKLGVFLARTVMLERIFRLQNLYSVEFDLMGSSLISSQEFKRSNRGLCRSQWPCGLRRRSTTARLLRLWVRISPRAWMFVCCECFVLSGRGLCDELITRPEESYRLWRIVVCYQETS